MFEAGFLILATSFEPAPPPLTIRSGLLPLHHLPSLYARDSSLIKEESLVGKSLASSH
jgi:hypothetical protein